MSMIGTHGDLLELIMEGRALTPYAAGDVVFNRGDECDGMYLVGRGAVALKHGDRVIETVTAPGLFGELAVIESEPRSLTAIAETDAGLLKLTEHQFWVLVHDTPYFAQVVMHVMARRLRRNDATS
jgi:CRP-like cAMP-binding protein